MVYSLEPNNASHNSKGGIVIVCYLSLTRTGNMQSTSYRRVLLTSGSLLFLLILVQGNDLMIILLELYRTKWGSYNHVLSSVLQFLLLKITMYLLTKKYVQYILFSFYISYETVFYFQRNISSVIGPCSFNNILLQSLWGYSKVLGDFAQF